jgi:hypothetical protein
MFKAFIYTIILASLQVFPLCPVNYAADETWDAMMDGIKKYSSDRKLREKFDALCRENETALIDGRIDTGGGLYMIMDVPVYRAPGNSKITELAHDAVVVLTGASNELDGKTWKEIEFLFISAHSKTAISIDKAWVESSNLKGNS